MGNKKTGTRWEGLPLVSISTDSLQKMQSEIDLARESVAMCIRLVVGSGLIRDEVLLALRDLRFRGDIMGFEPESFNAGAVLVRLK